MKAKSRVGVAVWFICIAAAFVICELIAPESMEVGAL